ncbi:MAG: CpsB/CapC family capsule biosynthesis tyrosine phosphatase [Ferruginibacter sp.]
MFNFFKKKKNEGPVPEYLPFYTDIHSHILPGIDDGSPDISTSLQLIEGLQRLGIRQSVATPHIIGDLYRNNTQTIRAALEQVREACRKKGITMEISAAAEYMIDDYFFGLLQKDEPLLTLHKNLLLTEIPFSTTPENLEETVAAIKEKGYKPILAHPERYSFFQQQFDSYFYLVEIGFTLQANLLSLTGYYGSKAEKAAKFIFDNELAALVGTDLHHHRHLAAISSLHNREIFHQYLGKRMLNDLDAVALNLKT